MIEVSCHDYIVELGAGLDSEEFRVRMSAREMAQHQSPRTRNTSKPTRLLRRQMPVALSKISLARQER